MSQQVFFELLRAGLWEKEAQLLRFNNVDYSDVMRLAEEQSVIGLITAGLEKVADVKVPQIDLLQFVGSTLQIEQQNRDLNDYVAKLIERLRKEDVYAILVKGQGIAQCYERPLWRVSGDVDLLLSEDNYKKAKGVLLPQAVSVGKEYKSFKHLGLTMEEGFVVELHGTLHSRLSKRVDRVIDKAQRDIFYGGEVRSWMNGNTSVFLPSPDCDIIFVFTHILHHFFIDGIGLRQICDWCRLLWRYRKEIDVALLEKRLNEVGLMSEWRAFAALAVLYLGMPVDAMPLFNDNDNQNEKLKKKAERIMQFVLETGNLGHNRIVNWSNSRIIQKVQSAWKKTSDLIRLSKVFPLDSIKFFFHFLLQGIKSTIKGE